MKLELKQAWFTDLASLVVFAEASRVERLGYTAGIPDVSQPRIRSCWRAPRSLA